MEANTSNRSRSLSLNNQNNPRRANIPAQEDHPGQQGIFRASMTNFQWDRSQINQQRQNLTANQREQIQYQEILRQLNRAVAALGGQSLTEEQLGRTDPNFNNNQISDGTHWCHTCQKKITLSQQIFEDNEQTCPDCQSCFIEKIEQNNQDYAFDIPRQGVDGQWVSNNQQEQDRRDQNSQLVKNMLDMALSRIRVTNPAFRDAQLMGAQIRVRSTIPISVSQVRLGDNLNQGLARIEGNLPALQTLQRGMLQDMLMSDLLTHMRLRNLQGQTNQEGRQQVSEQVSSIDNQVQIEQLQRPVQIDGVQNSPLGLMQLLMGEGQGGRGGTLFFGDGIFGMRLLGQSTGQFGEQSLQEIIQQIMENDPNRYGPPPASKKAIESLKRTHQSEFTDQKIECSVCITPICQKDPEKSEENQWIYEMPCDHIFHEDCLMPWLQQHNSCPSCRHELVTDDQDYEIRKQELQRRQQENQNSTQSRGVGP